MVSNETPTCDYEENIISTGYNSTFAACSTEYNYFIGEIYSIVEERNEFHREPFLMHISGFKHH